MNLPFEQRVRNVVPSLLTAVGQQFKWAPRNTAWYLGQGVARRAGMRHLIVRLDTSWKCNLRCQMCHFSAEDAPTHPPMDLDLFRKIAADLFPRTVYLGMSCGAEPFMTRGFEEYLAIAAEYRIPYLMLVTNATLMRERQIEALIDSKVREVVVSIDGATKETYERIRVNGRFDKLLANLRLFDEIKRRRGSKLPHLRFNLVVMRDNVGELAEFVDLVAPFGPRKIQLRHMGINDGMQRSWEDASARTVQDQFDRELARFKAQARKRGIATDAPESFAAARRRTPRRRTQVPGCINPWASVYIHPDGRFRPCLYHSLDTMPGFATHTYDEIAASMKDIKRLLKVDQTNSCLQLCQPRRGKTHSVSTEGLVQGSSAEG